MTNNAELKTNCNTLSVTKECIRIPGEGLWTNSSWFLWIRAEVLYEALLIKHKYGTHKQTQAYKIWQYNVMHNVRERVRESESNANTKICFEVRAPSSMSPPSHRRISTNSSTQDLPHREPPPRIWGKYNLRVYNSSLQQLQPLNLEVRHKPIQYQPHKWGIGTKPNNHLSLEGLGT